MKKVNFKNLKKIETLSEFQAHKLIENTPKSELLTPRKYELARTKEWVLFQKSKKKKTKESFSIRRLCSLLSKQHRQNVEYYPEENKIIVDRFCYIIADMCNSKEEYEYFLNKIKSPLIKRVISLRKSDFCKYFVLDTKSIRNYYKNEFKFPDYFREYIKMRAFRAMSVRSGFIFNGGRLNDTLKSTAERKFVRYFGKDDTGKVYFSLARTLDNVLDKFGKGFMLKNLIYLAVDIDGDCKLKHGFHSINEIGICSFCWEDANKKLKRLKNKKIDGFKIEKVLFSGGRGFQVHCSLNNKREVTENEILDVVTKINQGKKIVDEFLAANGKGFDVFRVFRVPKSISAETALIVDELPLKRIGVLDKIIKPKMC